jgi:hypothetical protein
MTAQDERQIADTALVGPGITSGRLVAPRLHCTAHAEDGGCGREDCLRCGRPEQLREVAPEVQRIIDDLCRENARLRRQAKGLADALRSALETLALWPEAKAAIDAYFVPLAAHDLRDCGVGEPSGLGDGPQC